MSNMKTTTIFKMTVLFLIVLSVVSCKGNKGGLDNQESDTVMFAKKQTRKCQSAHQELQERKDRQQCCQEELAGTSVSCKQKTGKTDQRFS